MPKPGQSVADANREIRTTVLREQLEAGGHLQHVLDLIDKMDQLASMDKDTMNKEELSVWTFRLNALEKTIAAKMKLINKFLPDARQVDFKPTEQGKVVVLNYTGVHDEDEDEDVR